jgi:hypothetical protein
MHYDRLLCHNESSILKYKGMTKPNCTVHLDSLKQTVLKCQSVPTPVPAPWNKHTKTIKKKPMAVHYSCACDDGCK